MTFSRALAYDDDMSTSMETAIKAKQAKDFTATDSEGRPITLSDYKGKTNVVLVFNRGFT
jgi:peroxiredoxin